MERYYICILSILLDLMLTGSTNYENPVNYIWISGFKTLTLVLKKKIIFKMYLYQLIRVATFAIFIFQLKKSLERPFIPCGLPSFRKWCPGRSKEMLQRKVYGPPLPPNSLPFSPSPPCTLNIWTNSSFHSIPFPLYLHIALQGNGSFSFYLCWALRK